MIEESHMNSPQWLVIFTFGGVAPAVSLGVVRQREQVDTGSSGARAEHSDT